jgi:CopZ-like zinc binding protein
MDECCCPPSPDDPAHRRPCPVSGAQGSPVDLITVKALLTERALQRISVLPHRFCPDPACAVVYFDANGQVFTVDDVRVAVWQKAPGADRTICYCFGENEADLRRDAGQVVERVRAHIAAGRCACEVRNPRGTCCLGELIAAGQAGRPS